MEDALVLLQSIQRKYSSLPVLILVVMEDALVLLLSGAKIDIVQVLILVVMEDALVQNNNVVENKK